MYLERVIQRLYPLTLWCDSTAPTQEHFNNAEAEEFRPRRNTSEIAQVRINGVANYEKECPFNEWCLTTND